MRRISRLSSRLARFILVMVMAIVLSNYPYTGVSAESVEALLLQSHQRYEKGQIEEAKVLLKQVQQQTQGQGLTAAVALSNLALIASDQGNWTIAQTSIQQSMEVLQSIPPTPQKTEVMAKVLNVQGRVQLIRGEAQAALQTWQQSATLYGQIKHQQGMLQSQIRQAQALQAMGLHSRAYRDILEPMKTQLEQQPDSLLKAEGLRSLGEAISVVGDRAEAQKTLADSLAIAERLKNPPEIAASKLTLANLLSANIRETRRFSPLNEGKADPLQKDIDRAIKLYQEAADISSTNRLRANLNQLALLVASQRTSEAQKFAAKLQPEILALPPDRSSIEARLNFANSLLTLAKTSGSDQGQVLTALLTTAVEQARQLNDPRLIANALGHLGRAQAQDQRFDLAQATTEQALLVAQSVRATEQVYRWSAQLGRFQEQQGDRDAAIKSYTQAVNTLRSLRQDLLGINADSQLVEAETLEPVHRQLVSLMLPKDVSQPDNATLIKTRNVIESLQLEEINTYLRANCLPSSVELDNVVVNTQTAIIYPMILPDRIALIVSVVSPTAPGQKDGLNGVNKIASETKLYTQPIDQITLTKTVNELQMSLRNRISFEYETPSQQLYDWLIKPIVPQLQAQKVETLVFVLDGVLRNIPMAALSNGEQFLVEQYSIATTLGLKLTTPKPLQAQALSGVGFGLTEPSKVGDQKFSELPFVATELKDFQQEIAPSTVVLNKDFTRDQFKTILQKSVSPIVHLATHGQFSSNLEKTFLVTSDGVITTGDLETALGAGNSNRSIPIELLVLSACETAIGDERAPLGIAGIALKSGARSTVSSLWKVNDNATAVLMQKFYQVVSKRQVSKAVALQQAQRAILEDPQFRRHPYYWAPFILVGNWL